MYLILQLQLVSPVARLTCSKFTDCANCIVLRTVVLTQYRRVTDGQTDGIAVASTSLAMRCHILAGGGRASLFLTYGYCSVSSEDLVV